MILFFNIFQYFVSLFCLNNYVRNFWASCTVNFKFLFAYVFAANAGYLNYRLCFLAEEFVNSFINNCVFFGLLLQIFHTAPTIHRATWTLTIVGSFAFTAPLFKCMWTFWGLTKINIEEKIKKVCNEYSEDSYIGLGNFFVFFLFFFKP